MAPDLNLIFSVGGPVFAIGVSWGIMEARWKSQQKQIDTLEEELKETQRTYVRMDHFEAITEPLQAQISEIRSDIKKVLFMLSREQRDHHRGN